MVFPALVLDIIFRFTDHRVLFVCKQWYKIAKPYAKYYYWKRYIEVYDHLAVDPDIPLWVLKKITPYQHIVLKLDNLNALLYARAQGYGILPYKMLMSNNLEIVKLLDPKKHNMNNCYGSSNLEVIKYAESLGASYLAYCFYTDNLDVLLYAESKAPELFKYGSSNWNWCLASSNIDVVKYAVFKGATNWDQCLSSASFEVVHFGEARGANYKHAGVSPNLFVRLYIKSKLGQI